MGVSIFLVHQCISGSPDDTRCGLLSPISQPQCTLLYHKILCVWSSDIMDLTREDLQSFKLVVRNKSSRDDVQKVSHN
jgi:hypothetical protein